MPAYVDVYMYCEACLRHPPLATVQSSGGGYRVKLQDDGTLDPLGLPGEFRFGNFFDVNDVNRTAVYCSMTCYLRRDEAKTPGKFACPEQHLYCFSSNAAKKGTCHYSVNRHGTETAILPPGWEYTDRFARAFVKGQMRKTKAKEPQHLICPACAGDLDNVVQKYVRQSQIY